MTTQSAPRYTFYCSRQVQKRSPLYILVVHKSTETYTKMNDRMGDVPMWAIESDDEEEEEKAAAAPPGKSSGGGDIEMGKVEEEPSYMTHFFTEIDAVKADIEFIKRATAKITKLSEEAIHATTTEKEQSLSKKLKPIVTETNKRAKRTKTLIGLLKEETKNLKTEGTLKPSDERYVCCFLFLYTSRRLFLPYCCMFLVLESEKIFVIHLLESLSTK